MCREQLPVWQEFYSNHSDANVEVVTVAIAAQGAAKARPYVQRANATFTTLVDEANLLSGLFGFKAAPNGLLVDEQGVLVYRKYGGFDIRKAEYVSLVEEWLRNPSAEWLASRMEEDTVGGSQHKAAIAYFRRGLELYSAANVLGALAEWKKGSDLEPDNWVIRKQIWAVEQPDKFYNGDVDYDWQREQVRKGI